MTMIHHADRYAATVADRPADGAPLVLHERVVLKKFEGDLTDDECTVATPLEAVVVEDGVIVDRWTPEEDRPCPE